MPSNQNYREAPSIEAQYTMESILAEQNARQRPIPIMSIDENEYSYQTPEINND